MSAPVPILLMSYDLRVGGTERQLAEAAKHLDRERFAPHVGCIRLQGHRRAEIERAGVPTVEFSFPSFYSASVVAAARRMARYVKRHGIQLVHTFDVPANLFGVPVAKACRIPVVLSSQRAFRELTPGIYHRLLRVTDRLVDGTVVNSATLRDHLAVIDGVDPQQMMLCYNGINLEHFSPGPDRADVLAHCSPVIGSTAVLRPEKGVATLLEAFAVVAQRYSSAGLLLVGGGPEQVALEARAHKLGLADRCYFAGAVTDVAPWLRSMDFFVLPSLSEALSNSLLEAMACGCTVVASNTGGNPELIADGRSGRLFPPGDAPALARVLESLMEDGGACARMREQARAFVASNCSREASLAKLSAYYAEQLAIKGVRTR
jgi:glycosyltransferase involved in cell wall biosynthesis